ncbi:DUF3644 domain-containing protein [Micromonospora arida]|uniref:DUF3644 domain-containing protein n=1 Tax=Micromonospora arida TaxID=2203715 RepID=UPI0033EEBC5D
MNLRGSWRRLLGNSMSAMLAAIENYNKPRVAYRDEIFVILLINAWELLLKAIVSKSGKRIYYPKKRGEAYRTLTCNDAFWRAANSGIWPKSVAIPPVQSNIELLSTYRDSAIHFYNNRAFGTLIYSLAQTSIINFRDVASAVFGKDLADEITWRIMPLGIENPTDPIQFMKGNPKSADKNRAVQDFLSFLQEKADALDNAGIATDRLCTMFDVSLNSVKKIEKADIVVGIASDDLADAFVVNRRVDPNVSHPYRRKDVLPKLKREITTYQFDAIVFVDGLRDDPKYCWKADGSLLVKWSTETIRHIDKLSDQRISDITAEYAKRFKKKS